MLKTKPLKLLLLSLFIGATTSLTFSFSQSPDLRQITKDPAHDYHVKWSPDGKVLAFTSQRSGEPKIWLVPYEGGNPVMLETGLSGDHHISWSPDGKQLAFDAGFEGPQNIYTIPLKGGNPRRLSQNRAMDVHPS